MVGRGVGKKNVQGAIYLALTSLSLPAWPEVGGGHLLKLAYERTVAFGRTSVRTK
jgi:hypothetical protein